MPTEKVIAGAAAYTDKDGHERWAQNGEEIDISQAEADRLHELGALFDQKAEDARVKAEEDARQAQLDYEEQARATEKERVAGEAAAAAKAEKATSQARASRQGG